MNDTNASAGVGNGGRGRECERSDGAPKHGAVCASGGARITEVFKLMSFWGLLLEYGPPEPEPDSDEDDAPGAPTPHTPGIFREAYTPVKPEERKGDPKRVALLSDAR